MKITKVWAAEYNSCIFESAFAPISLHLTLEGAERAVEEHKEEAHREWKRCGYDGVRDYEKWQVREVEVLE